MKNRIIEKIRRWLINWLRFLLEKISNNSTTSQFIKKYWNEEQKKFIAVDDINLTHFLGAVYTIGVRGRQLSEEQPTEFLKNITRNGSSSTWISKPTKKPLFHNLVKHVSPDKLSEEEYKELLNQLDTKAKTIVDNLLGSSSDRVNKKLKELDKDTNLVLQYYALREISEESKSERCKDAKKLLNEAITEDAKKFIEYTASMLTENQCGDAKGIDDLETFGGPEEIKKIIDKDKQVELIRKSEND